MTSTDKPADTVAHTAPEAATAGMPLSWIRPSTLNPRKHFDEEGITELAESIRRDGLLQPILVREVSATHFEIIAGERRFRAAQRAGLSFVPVRVLRDVDDRRALQLALIENLQRRDLDPIEEAQGYRRLREAVGLKQGEIASAVNRSQPAIAKSLGLLELPEDVQQLIRTGELSVAHGVALGRYKHWPKVASLLAKYAIDHRATSKALEGDLPGPAAELLAQKKVAVPMGYGQDFAECKKCPYAAYRRSAWGAYCLQPEHYAQLDAEYKQKQQREAARELAIARETGKAVELTKLRPGQYVNLQAWNVPSGCSADCACRATAVESTGTLRLICTDPERFKRLTSADNQATIAEERRRTAEALAVLHGHLDGLEAPSERLMAVIVAAALRYERTSAITGPARRHKIALEIRGWQFSPSREHLTELARHPVRTQILFVAEVILGAAIARVIDGDGRQELLQFYAEVAPPLPTDQAPAPVDICAPREASRDEEVDEP